MDQLTTREIQALIGTRLRQTRLGRNLSVDDVARRAGVNRKTLLAMEGGEDIKLSSLLKVLRVMGRLNDLEAVFPDLLPSPGAFMRRGLKLRQNAYPLGTKRKPREAE